MKNVFIFSLFCLLVGVVCLMVSDERLERSDQVEMVQDMPDAPVLYASIEVDSVAVPNPGEAESPVYYILGLILTALVSLFGGRWYGRSLGYAKGVEDVLKKYREIAQDKIFTNNEIREFFEVLKKAFKVE